MKPVTEGVKRWKLMVIGALGVIGIGGMAWVSLLPMPSAGSVSCSLARADPARTKKPGVCGTPGKHTWGSGGGGRHQPIVRLPRLPER
ncbi:hypothetical protein J2Y48_004530 [Mycoplana sp. BE70]|nr:hypothetical protein [Mycoplana sp. BE70]